MRTRKILFLLSLLSVVAGAGDKGFSPPAATHARTYPAREMHDDEGVSIAIDPYDTPEKAAIFKIKYREIGFLPVRLIISNDSAQPLMLDDMKVEYITVHRDKIDPAVKDDIYRRIARPEKVTHKPTVRLPIPTGPNKRPVAISKEAREEVSSALFVGVPVTPQSTNSGFLFFDVSDLEEPEAGAHIYISGIRSGTKELFYFDIPLEKYLSHVPGK